MSLLVTKLERCGYEVKVAGDGITGLEIIHAKKPDLVILDMLLPRMNGFETLEKLHEEKILPSLPVIIISNSGQPVEINRAMALGVCDYLVKVNFDPKEIIEKVKRVFGTTN